MPQEPSAISGINPSGNTTNVAVTTAGYIVTSSTSGGTSGIANSTAAAIGSAVATTSGTLLQAANASRKGLIVYNQGTSPALIAYTTVAGSTTYSFQLNATDYWEMPVPLSGVGMAVVVSTTLTGGTATVFVTELT